MMRLGQPRGLAPGLSLLALLASITTARGQNFASDFNVDGGAGSPSCPCIEAPQPPSASDAPCVDVSFVDPTTGVSQVCLSPSYGLGSCQAWDTGANSPLSECHSLAPPTYCSRRWCWVDANNCDRAFGLSSIEYMYPSLQSSSDLVPAGPDVGYSYTTCGNLDSYSENSYVKALEGQVLRVGFPGDSSTGYTLQTDEETGNKTGSVVAFMQRVADRGRFTYEVHNVTDASKAKYTSSFTACVHDVALGELDLCIANFWVTIERLQLATFSSSMYDDDWRLVVRKEEAHSSQWLPASTEELYAHMKTPLMPFTASAWWWILCTVAYMSIGLHVVESSSHYIEPAGETESSSTTPDISTDRDDYTSLQRFIFEGEGHDNSWSHKFFKKLNGLGSSAYLGLVGLASGSPAHVGASVPAKIIIAGFAMFTCIFLAAYTASSAAFLVNASVREFAINNLDEAFANEQMVCIRSAIKDNFRYRYPQYNAEQLKTYDQAQEMIDALEANDCVAVVIAADGWDASMRGDENEGCDKVVVQHSLFSESNGVPVREDYAHAISFLIAELKATGLYSELADEYRSRLLPPRQNCRDKLEYDGEEVASLDTYHMLAPLLVCWVLTTSGIVLYYVADYSDNFSWIQRLVREHDNKELVDELKNLPFSQLRERAHSSGLKIEDIDAALDKTEQKGHDALVDLILIAEEKVGLDRLYDQSVSSLYHMAVDAGAKPNRINRCLDHRNQKEAFIAMLTKILDTNHDGHVSLAEMTAVASSSKNLVNTVITNPLEAEETDTTDEDAASVSVSVPVMPSAAPQQVTVVVPAGATAGTQLRVDPDGPEGPLPPVLVTIPEGAVAGMPMQVMIPAGIK